MVNKDTKVILAFLKIAQQQSAPSPVEIGYDKFFGVAKVDAEEEREQQRIAEAIAFDEAVDNVINTLNKVDWCNRISADDYMYGIEQVEQNCGYSENRWCCRCYD